MRSFFLWIRAADERGKDRTMSKVKKVIDATEYPNTLEGLQTGLKSIGLESGDTVIVHASLSQIGWTIGAERTVIEALLAAVEGSGTIVMPSFTTDNSDPGEWRNPPVPNDWFETICRRMPAYDKNITPSFGVGRIAELFRTFPKTRRSDHPQVSFAANGKYSSQILETHVLTPAFGMDSPLGALYRLNASILLIGVSYDRCSALHLSEVLSARTKSTRSGAAMIRGGKREWVWFDEPAWNSDDFETIGRDFESETDYVVSGTIGAAKTKLIPLRMLVDYAKDWMTENRAVPPY